MLSRMGSIFDRVAVTAEGRIAVMAFNQPEILNAVSARMIAGAMAALDFIESEGKFRALVLTGEGKGFCAGANLSRNRARASAPATCWSGSIILSCAG